MSNPYVGWVSEALPTNVIENMMLFINTRPQKRAENLTDFLQNQSINVIDLPLLELIAKPLDPQEQTFLNNIAQTQAIILVSEEAVTHGLTALAQIYDLSKIAKLPLTWLAVGEKTADCFHQTWQNFSNTAPPNVIFPSEKSQQNNEGLLNLAKIQSLTQGETLQIWRGVGGRELLANTLTAKDIDVQLINFYQRILPKASVEKFTILHNQFSKNEQKFVLISSLTAWQNWQQLLTNSPLDIDDFCYVVLQNRIAQSLHMQNIKNICVINDLSNDTILFAIENTC